MKQRIFYYILLTVFLATSLVVALFSWLSYHNLEQETQAILQQQALSLKHQELSPQLLEQLAQETPQTRYTLINKQGDIIYDSSVDATSLENHSQRQEVLAALKDGRSFAYRESNTMGEQMLYCAVKLPNEAVLRLARGKSAIWNQYLGSLHYLALILIIVLACAYWVAHNITKKILTNLESVTANKQNTEVYPEFANIATQLHMQELRREFTANVSHELKTPLQSILGYSEIIMQGLVKPEDYARFLEKINLEAHKLLELIDDVLKLSKLDELQADSFTQFNLGELLQTIEERFENKAKVNQVNIHLAVPQEPCCLEGCQSVLEECFVNLIDNAIKYNRSGGRVEIKLEALTDELVVSISDSGMGIAAEEQEKIFERFYRVDHSHNKRIEGTGLGLAIVKHGIALHGGTIKVKSELNQGAKFIVELPKSKKQ